MLIGYSNAAFMHTGFHSSMILCGTLFLMAITFRILIIHGSSLGLTAIFIIMLAHLAISKISYAIIGLAMNTRIDANWFVLARVILKPRRRRRPSNLKRHRRSGGAAMEAWMLASAYMGIWIWKFCFSNASMPGHTSPQSSLLIVVDGSSQSIGLLIVNS